MTSVTMMTEFEKTVSAMNQFRHERGVNGIDEFPWIRRSLTGLVMSIQPSQNVVLCVRDDEKTIVPQVKIHPFDPCVAAPEDAGW